jgi:hypothetical protein
MQLSRVALAAILFCQWLVVTPTRSAHALSMSTLSQPLLKAGKLIRIKGGVRIPFLNSALKPAAAVDFMNTTVANFAKTSPAFIASLPKITYRTAIDFTPQALSFFFAIGLTNARKLVTQYHENPGAMDQFVQSQKDPIGQVGFLAFMMANGYSTAALQAVLAPNSRLGALIPFLGMSTGMIASDLVGEISQFSNINACVDEIQKRSNEPKKYENCQKAYESWGAVLADKGLEMIPSIASLMASVVVSGAISKYATAAGMFLVNKVIIAVCTHFALNVATGGGAFAVTASRLLAGAIFQSVIPNYIFVELNDFMRSLIQPPFNDLRQGISLARQEDKIVRSLMEKKSHGWEKTTPEGTPDFDSLLQQFIESGREWRSFNLLSATTAYASWHQYMSNFVTTYKGAQDFYTNFAEQRAKHLENSPLKLSFLDSALPLAGVTAAPPQGAFKDIPLEPLLYQKAFSDHQIVTLIELRKKLVEQMKQNIPIPDYRLASFRDHFLGNLPTTSDFTENKINYKKIAEALQWLNNQCDISNLYPGLTAPTGHQPGFFGDYRDFLNEIRTSIGNPWPLAKPGMAYLMSYEQDANVAALHQGISTPQKSSEGFRIFHPTDFFIAQMVSGPDAAKGESLVDFNRWNGYPAQFLPPRITRAIEIKFSNPEPPGIIGPTDWDLGTGKHPSIFNVPVKARFGGSETQYPNLFAILRDDRTIDQDIFVKSDISSWWTTNIEPQFLKAWEVFESRYFPNVVELVEHLKDTRDDRLNVGPLSNNILSSLLQERRMYMLILGEIFKDKILITKPELVPSLVDTTTSPRIDISKISRDQTNKAGQVSDLPLLRLLKFNYNFDLVNLQTSLGNEHSRLFAHSASKLRNLKFQSDLEVQFGKLEGMIKSYQIENVKDQNGKLQKKLLSAVKNSEFTSAHEEIEKNLSQIQQLFDNSGVQLDKFQKSIVTKCIYALAGISGEIANLGMMANSGSYARSQEQAKADSQVSSECSNSELMKTKEVTARIKCMERMFE